MKPWHQAAKDLLESGSDHEWLLAAALEERDRLVAQLAATAMELERFRHGVQTYSDFVCPKELHLADALKKIEELETRNTKAETKAWILKGEIYDLKAALKKSGNTP